MPRVLALSPASVNVPHRKTLDLLARRHAWEVHIALPKRLDLGQGRYKECAPSPPDARYHLEFTSVRLVNSGRFVFFDQLPALVRRIRPDVVFAEFDPGTLATIHAALWSRPFGARIVPFTPENIERDRLRDAVRAALRVSPGEVLRDLGVAALDATGRVLSDGLACMSPEGHRIFSRVRGWKQPISMMPLGTDTTLFCPMDATPVRRELDLRDEFVVGYFGRMIPEKGVHHLLEAFARLPSNSRLLLDMYRNFLPGSYADTLLRQAASLGVRDRVLTIDVGHSEVPRYMNACDVVVLPSISSPRWIEQFGRVVPEAMACGVPVVGSSSGTIPFLIGDSGLIFKEGDVHDLTRALMRLHTDPPLRHGLGLKGRARCIELWSVDVQARLLDQLFRRTLGQREDGIGGAACQERGLLT